MDAETVNVLDGSTVSREQSRKVAPPELLAPAGDWECVRAAVENGADAIYFGLERFNARMRAKNFTQADLPELMAYLHRRGVRGYVTFNTLVFTSELEDAADYLRGIIAAGVDAAIVQDVGICRLIRSLSPDFPIHTSTQMTVTSAAGVAFARELGAQLVVLARENSIAEIEKIQTALGGGSASLPLEVFVHGALCVAYSGQCLTSEALGGRSANRGECAQACRLPYELWSDGVKVDLGDRRYLLSPQDLAGIDVLPDLIRAGVASLKIEGRLKSPEYVASITRVYRGALDRAVRQAAESGARDALPDDSERRSGAVEVQGAKDRYELEMSFSRGLYTGWFRGIDNQRLAHGRFGTKRGVFLGTVERVSGDSVSLRLNAPLKPGDGVVFDAGTPDVREEGGRVYQVEIKSGEARLRFGHGDIDFRRVKAGNRLWKTNDPALDREVRATFAGDKVRFQRQIVAQVHGRVNAPLTLLLDDGQGHVVKRESGMVLEPAQTQPLNEGTLTAQLSRLGGTPFKLDRLDCHLEGEVMLPLSELNRLRREAVAALEALRAQPHRWTLNDCGREVTKVAQDSIAVNGADRPPELIATIRERAQLEPAWRAGARTIYCEFENPKHYRDVVAEFRGLQSAGGAGVQASSIWVAPPRIFKTGEEWILKQVRSCEADGYLVRNHDHLAFFANDRRRGDFSLNVANPLTAEYFIRRYGLERVTASYDLNVSQVESLLRAAPAGWFDLTIHQHMPMFHMEHCVFCAFLSSGRDYRDCGRPCDTHRVVLKDRVGAELPLKADAGCRNTVFNNRAQTGAEFTGRFQELGARSFRVEFLNEGADEVFRTVTRYAQLLSGVISGADLWRELKLINQIGVTRGQMEAAPQVVRRKS
ncbi:MAG: U32 family peptidase [Opitutaceae bacterium]|nr:U32 family peptidase [Opitutaceae bacterium]